MPSRVVGFAAPAPEWSPGALIELSSFATGASRYPASPIRYAISPGRLAAVRRFVALVGQLGRRHLQCSGEGFQRGSLVHGAFASFDAG